MLVLMMAFVGVVLVSCNKEDDDSENDQDNPVPVEKEQASMRTGYYYSTYGDGVVKKKANTYVLAGDVYRLKHEDWAHYTEPVIHVAKGNIIELVDRYVDDFYGKASPSMWYEKKSYSLGSTTATLYFYVDNHIIKTTTYTLDGNKIITSDKSWYDMTYENGKITNTISNLVYERAERLGN